MDVSIDSHPTHGNTIQNTSAEEVAVDLERESGNINIRLDEDSVLGNLSVTTVHLDVVTNNDVIDMRNAIYPFKSDQEHSNVRQAENETLQEDEFVNPQNDSDQVVLSASSDEVHPSALLVVPAGGSTSVTDINDSEVGTPTIVCSQEPPLLRASEMLSYGEREGEADPDDPSNHVCGAGLTHEEETQEDFDYPCEDFPSSQPPSSSPPHIFSSSPCTSSQSSVNGVEPSKMVPVDEVESSAGSHDCFHTNDVALQDKSRLESEQLHDGLDHVDVMSTETEYHMEIIPTTCFEGSPGSCKKRMVCSHDTDESYESRPKRPKSDSHHHLPPAPRRATLAAQNRQFKKLAAPFRPPSKLPVARDDLRVQTANTMTIESANCESDTVPEIDKDKTDLKELTTHLLPFHHKASDTSRSTAQFKSPLVNRVLPADSRTIRLTPALQALERRLQLLKRAIKVKEDNEEEVLGRLAGKWIEAGREVAYDVWDATKDAADFGGRATLVRRSYGWENTTRNDGNTLWGWDTKVGDAGEETGNLDRSVTGRLALEEDEDDEDEVGFNHTLGTMLRQLGIAPEIFGWDDEKEAFSD